MTKEQDIPKVMKLDTASQNNYLEMLSNIEMSKSIANNIKGILNDKVLMTKYPLLSEYILDFDKLF